MRALNAQQLLPVWESGQGQLSAERALALLAAACPESSIESLAALSVGQRDGRLLRLREWAFGSSLAGIADCPRCDQRLEMSFSADDIRSGAEDEMPERLSLSVEEYDISFRLPNSFDLVAAARAKEAGRSAMKHTLLERCVLQASHRGAQTNTSQLPPNVIAALSQRMAEADPQCDVHLELDCPNCGHQWEALFDIVSFFWSEIDVWARRVLRDVHILASAYAWSEDAILAMSPGRRQIYLAMLGA
jgi:hypothetical protein